MKTEVLVANDSLTHHPRQDPFPLWIKRRFQSFLSTTFIFIIVSCNRSAQEQTSDSSSPTYSTDIAPILNRHCLECHQPGRSGPFALLTYDDTKKRSKEIAAVTAEHQMPPWLPADGFGTFEGERRLRQDEIDTFRRWHANGAPEGTPNPNPTLAKLSNLTEWKLGPPDLILHSEPPFTLPADGLDVYRHLILPVTNNRTRYVRAVEFKPGSRAVHHAFIRVDRTGTARRLDAKDEAPGFPGMDTPTSIQSPEGHFLSWQPGRPPMQMKPGEAWTLRRGTDLVVQLHLQPRGKPEPIPIEIGLYFTDQVPTNTPAKLALSNYEIDIPANSQATVTDRFVAPVDLQITALLPHTHYLGRSIEAKCRFPDGREQWLIYIPRWNFNWQSDYVLKEPLELPKGTSIDFKLVFDNTVSNPFNPNSPPVRVTFGMSTTNEMAELWIQLSPKNSKDRLALDRELAQRFIRDASNYNKKRIQLNPKDARAHLNLGSAYLSQQRNEDARKEFLEAIGLDQQLDEPHYFLGLLGRYADRNSDAEREFREALRLNPQHGKAHGNLGFLALERQSIAEATQHFEAALSWDPWDVLALEQLARIAIRRGDYDVAIPYLERALENSPNDRDLRQLLEETRANVKSSTSR